METEGGPGPERLVTFADAVVAIAITLLVLPLIEVDAREPLGELLLGRLTQYVGFVISFFVIARLWWGHHRIFQHVVRVSRGLVLLTVTWLFTVVLFPVATAITDSYDPNKEPGAIALYIGVMTLSGGLLTAMSAMVLRRPQLTDGEDRDALRRLIASADTTAGFLIALVIGTAIPAVNYFSLLVLLITGQIGRLVNRRMMRRTSSRGV